MKSYLLLLITLTITCRTIMAQSEVSRALVFLGNGDTLNGWIDYQHWQANPRDITFRHNPDKKTGTILGVREIKKVWIAGKDEYVRAFVKKDMRPIVPEYPLPLDAVRLEPDTVLLRSLVKGKLELYELIEPSKPHYYIRAAGGEFEELEYIEAEVGDEFKAYSNFRTQIGDHIPHHLLTLQIVHLINSTEYNAKELVECFQAVNQLLGRQSYVTPAVSLRRSFWFAGIETGVTGLSIAQYNIWQPAVKGGYGNIVGLTAGYDNNLSFKYLPRLIARFSASATMSSLVALSKEDDPDGDRFHIRQYGVWLGAAVLRRYFLSHRMAAYVGPGVNVQFSEYEGDVLIGGNKRSADYFAFDPFHFNLSLHAGIRSGNMSFMVSVHRSTDISAGVATPKINLNYYKLNVLYHFTKH